MSIVATLVPSLTAAVSKVIDNLIPDKDLAAQIKREAATQIHDRTVSELSAKKDVLIAELQGESSMQRNWRPFLMYFLMFVLGWNTIILPLLAAIFSIQIPIIDIYKNVPTQLWDLLMIGMGGYIAGRTLEKITTQAKSGVVEYKIAKSAQKVNAERNSSSDSNSRTSLDNLMS